MRRWVGSEGAVCCLWGWVWEEGGEVYFVVGLPNYFEVGEDIP